MAYTTALVKEIAGVMGNCTHSGAEAEILLPCTVETQRSAPVGNPAAVARMLTVTLPGSNFRSMYSFTEVSLCADAAVNVCPNQWTPPTGKELSVSVLYSSYFVAMT